MTRVRPRTWDVVAGGGGGGVDATAACRLELRHRREHCVVIGSTFPFDPSSVAAGFLLLITP